MTKLLKKLKGIVNIKKGDLNMQETIQENIGLSAGKIYNYLADNGEVTFSKMKKDLDLKGNFADLGLGWLAREDKVDISKNGNSVKVKLR